MVPGLGARLFVSFLHYRKNPATAKLKELSDFPVGMSSLSFVVRRPASIDPAWRAIGPFRIFGRSAINRIQSRPFWTWCFGWLIPVTVIAVMGI